jgi:hypothetical protein
VTFGLLRGNSFKPFNGEREYRVRPGGEATGTQERGVLRLILLDSDRRLACDVQQKTVVDRLVEGQRAQRFAIHTRVLYRTTHGDSWHEGRMVNISESGVLFQADQAEPLNCAIDLRFSLPKAMTGEPAVQVACRGVIARVVSSPGSEGAMGLAARITKFHFVRQPHTPEDREI